MYFSFPSEWIQFKIYIFLTLPLSTTFTLSLSPMSISITNFPSTFPPNRTPLPYNPSLPTPLLPFYLSNPFFSSPFHSFSPPPLFTNSPSYSSLLLISIHYDYYFNYPIQQILILFPSPPHYCYPTLIHEILFPFFSNLLSCYRLFYTITSTL